MWRGPALPQERHELATLGTAIIQAQITLLHCLPGSSLQQDRNSPMGRAGYGGLSRGWQFSSPGGPEPL